MSRERPIVEQLSPSAGKAKELRGIVSPCQGCKNNIPINNGNENSSESIVGPVCPKKKLYATKNNANYSDPKFIGPIFNQDLHSINPVWPGLKKHNNGYAYIFVATYEDNVDNNSNPSFDTERIHCRGPYLIKSTERKWHQEGHLEQGDGVFITEKQFYIDGQLFKGFAEPGQIWQVARGYVREIDRNLTKSSSANGSI